MGRIDFLGEVPEPLGEVGEAEEAAGVVGEVGSAPVARAVLFLWGSVLAVGETERWVCVVWKSQGERRRALVICFRSTKYVVIPLVRLVVPVLVLVNDKTGSRHLAQDGNSG